MHIAAGIPIDIWSYFVDVVVIVYAEDKIAHLLMPDELTLYDIRPRHSMEETFIGCNFQTVARSWNASSPTLGSEVPSLCGRSTGHKRK